MLVFNVPVSWAPCPRRVIMPESTDNSLKTEVKAYWNRASCDTWHAQSQKFTPEYFEQIEEWRYRDQPFIHSFAQFTS